MLPTSSAAASPSAWRTLVWTGWLVAALLFLDFGSSTLYGVVVPASAALLALVPGMLPTSRRTVDRVDLTWAAALYVVVVGLLYVAFQVFTTAQTLGLFLCFAAALLAGTVGPIAYSVWGRHRRLADLGLGSGRWRSAVALGLVLAVVQFALTLARATLPADPVDWVPLAFMALMVGLFEAIFFRGFLQARLAASLGPIPGVGIAAGLYALYHVGYGMGWGEMLFLFGLGVVYGIAYACVPNVLVLWPLLIPMGSFYNNMESGDITLPWAALLGFLDVLALIATAVVLAARRQRRAAVAAPPAALPAPLPGSVTRR